MRSLKPLPEQFVRIILEISLDNSQMEIIKKGKVASNMDDRWVIIYNEPYVYFHRSWTGNCIYMARIEKYKETFNLVEVLVNAVPNQYKYTNDEEELFRFRQIFQLFLDNNL